MQYFKALILAAATVLIFYSCNPCSSPSWTNLGCLEDDQLNKIRMVRKTDKKDLLFGLTRVYDVSQIKVFTVKGVDTTFLNVRAIKDIGY